MFGLHRTAIGGAIGGCLKKSINGVSNICTLYLLSNRMGPMQMMPVAVLNKSFTSERFIIKRSLLTMSIRPESYQKQSHDGLKFREMILRRTLLPN